MSEKRSKKEIENEIGQLEFQLYKEGKQTGSIDQNLLSKIEKLKKELGKSS